MVTEQGNITKILDKGFIRLVDFLGGDAAVVESARVSFGKESKGEEADRKLIGYLMRNHHETPFEHAVFKFHIKCPIFVARQWFRHRMASYNEISGRYTKFDEEFYLPEKLRVQDVKNKQSSQMADLEAEPDLLNAMQDAVKVAFETYNKLIESGVAREMARIVLPLATYTQFYWTVNCRSLMNFLRLRLDSSAQWEIREYAHALSVYFKEKMPWTWESFSMPLLPTDK